MYIILQNIGMPQKFKSDDIFYCILYNIYYNINFIINLKNSWDLILKLMYTKTVFQ